MIQSLGLREPVVQAKAGFAPNLLVEMPPWRRVFLRNLADLFLPRAAQWKASSPPAPFWPDVFVSSRLPWWRIAESFLLHALTIAAVWSVSQLWLMRPHRVVARPFNPRDVVLYSASEYLPPLDTGTPRPSMAQPGDPAYAPQPIISVPPEPDNRSQTIVTPPDIRLTRDLPLPNIVAWANTAIPVPLAATSRAASQLTLPALPSPVVAPPPDAMQALEKRSLSLTSGVIAPPPELQTAPGRRAVQAIQPAIIEPPPGVELAAARISDLHMGHTEVVAPAPQLPMSEQRALGRMAAPGGAAAQAVAPPPSLEGAGTSGRGGKLIALNIHPAVDSGPIEPPAGNRHGAFAATPDGKPGASGTPEIRGETHQAGTRGGNGHGAAKNGVPPGLHVGPAPKDSPASAIAGQSGNGAAATNSVNPNLLARTTPTRVMGNGGRAASPVPDAKVTDLDRKVFGPRRFYSLSLNMPNLNSAGGSWIVRFAELKDEGQPGELIAPEATHKVDPAYPIELMRRNVQGTVTLRAVIRSDGTVGEVQVLRGVDDRLDEYARAALSAWRFRPALKNGNAVALEAVVIIPFRPQRRPF